jgi:hypothetical protein
MQLNSVDKMWELPSGMHLGSGFVLQSLRQIESTTTLLPVPQISPPYFSSHLLSSRYPFAIIGFPPPSLWWFHASNFRAASPAMPQTFCIFHFSTGASWRAQWEGSALHDATIGGRNNFLGLNIITSSVQIDHLPQYNMLDLRAFSISVECSMF